MNYFDVLFAKKQSGGGTPTLITKTITENGTYTASEDNADGYSQVTVAVEGFKKKSIANTPTDIASFNDGTANPMPSLEISIEPVQSGSRDPSPQNVRPISGWSGANVSRTGKNILSINEVYGNKAGITINNNVATGNNVSFSQVFFNIPKNLVGKQLTLSTKIAVTNNVTRMYSQAIVNNVQINGNNILSNTTGVTSVTFTPESTEDSFRITYGSGNGIITVSDFQVEIGSTATTYEPYQGSTLSIPFLDSSDNPITVYGGRLNVTAGELTVTHANIASYNGETINEPWISSMDAYSAGATPTTGAQVVYPLTTPQTYQLTPAQVTTLLEQNNISADCGQILQGEYFVTL